MQDDLDYDDENETEKKSELDIELDRIREEYTANEKKNWHEVEAFLKQARDAERKAFEVAEKHGFAFQHGLGRFVSSKIAKQADELSKKFPKFCNNDLCDVLDINLCYDWNDDIIEGYWEPSTC